MKQNEVPRDLLGRASSVDWFVSLGVSPIGLVVAGVLSSHVGVRTYLRRDGVDHVATGSLHTYVATHQRDRS